MKSPAKASEILEGFLNQRGIKKKLVQYNVFEIWSDVVGPTIASRTEPRKMQGDTLVVGVKNAAWANELSFMKPLILKKIKERLPDAVITDIRFTPNPR